MSSQDKPESHDVVLVHGRTDDGDGLKVLRSRDGKVESAEMRALREGRPITGAEVVCLKERAESPVLWDVEPVLTAPGPTLAASDCHAGPARVSSDAYRRGWEVIFGLGDGNDEHEPLAASELN